MTADLRYPIGKYARNENVNEEQRQEWINEIMHLPTLLAEAVSGLNDEQLDTPYRPGGWTVRQVTHHIGDSHINSIVRFKLALTEEQPTISPYDEERWALLGDTINVPLDVSLTLIAALHERWVYLLRSMSETDFARTFYHPANQRVTSLDNALGIYAWHGKHHVAHITSLRERMGW